MVLAHPQHHPTQHHPALDSRAIFAYCSPHHRSVAARVLHTVTELLGSSVASGVARMPRRAHMARTAQYRTHTQATTGGRSRVRALRKRHIGAHR